MMRHAVLSLECGSFVFADGAEISVSEVRFVGRDRLVRLEGVHSLEALEAQVDVWYREG